MANVVTSQILENGPRRVVMKFTGVFDGSGEETGVVKVNATSTGSLGVVMQGQTFYPGTHLKIVDMAYDVNAMLVRIQWEATSNVDIWVAAGNGAGPFVWLDSRAGFQGIVNTLATGATGSIAFTTVNANLGSAYSIMLTMTKNVPQS